MSKGDNLIGIPTKYKGIEMRSKLESKFAFFLDALCIEWIYEPQTFMLSKGFMYKPDFYLPKLKTWIEVKGIIKKHNKEISKCFVKDNNTELILVSATEICWFSTQDFEDGIGIDKDIYIGKCSHCYSYFFCSNLGSYHCRKCGKHEGDHDIRGGLNAFNDEDINFSNINSIKEGIQKYGVK